MSDTGTNIYAADLVRLQAAYRNLHQISTEAKGAKDNFLAHVGSTSGWAGVDDSFAKTQGPHAKKQDEAAIETVQALMGALIATVQAVQENQKNVQSTQNANIDAINQSASGNINTGKH
ncbi:hypothetical protein OH786_37480 (plasmid) [Streptomyces atratus]|uniref:Uncharacterized protein n=1 Tax=Streptomyces atratus TaxID=1893 RepID=A0A1K2F5L3_STRAR|nr:hypothetical protein [Streptomyces atratus]SFY43043.1 hypothetical protein SAMN02787144_103325 [Streptomyces atratus]